MKKKHKIYYTETELNALETVGRMIDNICKSVNANKCTKCPFNVKCKYSFSGLDTLKLFLRELANLADVEEE